MPIYEFRCLKCDACFEFLVMSGDEEAELRCPHCSSEDFERILSTTNYSVSEGSGKSAGAQATTRSCPSGSCTTYDLPGYSR